MVPRSGAHDEQGAAFSLHVLLVRDGILVFRCDRRRFGNQFFIDRSLGRVAVPTGLRDDGWDVVTLAEHYGMPRYEDVADIEWIADAASLGWAILVKDKRIRHRSAEIGAVAELVSDAPVGELRDLAASLGPDAEEAYVTTAEMLRAEGEARGEARGKARGKAEDILVVFEQRGIDVDDKSRELIDSCTDLDTLNGWFRRALKVDKASDLFAE